ncbi:hypothetical protein ACQ4PT_014708 [Festuca glaucescens]
MAGNQLPPGGARSRQSMAAANPTPSPALAAQGPTPMVFGRAVGPNFGLVSVASTAGFRAAPSSSTAPPPVIPQSTANVPFTLGTAAMKNKRKKQKKKPTVGTLIGKTLDADLLTLRHRNIVRISVAMRDPKVFEEKVIKSDVFVILKGYEFRFRKEAPDYVSESDFVPFVWKCSDKDDEAGKGPKDKNSGDANVQDLSASKPVDTDTPMPQVQDTTVQGNAAAMMPESVGIELSYAVTPINPNPQMPRGKEIVSQLRASATSFVWAHIGSTSGDSAPRQRQHSSPVQQNLDSAVVPAQAPTPTNGVFSPFWDTDNLSAAAMSATTAAHPNLSIMVGFGGDTLQNTGVNATFAPSSVDSWVANAASSLSAMINQYGLDGVDVDYEHFGADVDTFVECIGRLLTQLKASFPNVATSIAPFERGDIQEYYQALWSRYSGVIDYVNFQFYGYGANTNVDYYVKFYNDQQANYPGAKVLASFKTGDVTGLLSPEQDQRRHGAEAAGQATGTLHLFRGQLQARKLRV